MTDEFQYHYALVSGRTVNDSVVVGYKFIDQADFRAGQVQSWAFYFTDVDADTIRTDTPGRWPGYATGVWLSDSGRVYVALAQGELDIYDGLRSFDQFNEHHVGTALAGIWGLDDQHVWAYGGQPGRPGEVFGFDGESWSKLPDAPEWLLHVHGCAPDCVYGISATRAYRWDGRQWHETELRTKDSLACIWVESPDEIWATDQGGTLYAGKAGGWAAHARFDGPLAGVARWQGDIWMGGLRAGLLRSTGRSETIEVIKPNIPTRYFEARDQLLIPNENEMIGSNDGVKFFGFAEDSFRELTENEPFGE